MAVVKTIMDGRELELALARIALQLLERNSDTDHLALVGIHTGGVYLAERLQRLLRQSSGVDVPVASLDITLYRDDWSLISQNPIVKRTEITFPVEAMTLVLVDDVLYTGRTIRAALDAVMDFGRPRAIQLAVLVDRGGRELPVQPDFKGIDVTVGENEHVDVLFAEADGEDGVVLVREQG